MAEGREEIGEQSAPAPADATTPQLEADTPQAEGPVVSGGQAEPEAPTSKDAETLAWAERWLSPERLKPYLDDCEGDVELALELYEWNFRLGQALLHDIACLEVAPRNAYDRLMTERWQGDAHWLLDDASPVRKPIMRKQMSGMLDANRVNRKTIDTAVDSLPEGFGQGQLVSRLTLGFWVHLTDRSREAELWRTNLYLAWPRGMNRAELQRKLDGVLRLRNRIAYVERLFDPRLPELLPLVVGENALALFSSLCPEAVLHVYGEGGKPSVATFLGDGPAPVAVRVQGDCRSATGGHVPESKS